jgi:hypothetical protein
MAALLEDFNISTCQTANNSHNYSRGKASLQPRDEFGQGVYRCQTVPFQEYRETTFASEVE